MPEINATILIPDISGYTEFITTTELHHSTFAINALLDTMVKAVGEEYELSEIEGDALLLVKKGPPPTKQEILDTCLKILNSFHFQRKWMEQHTICPCNACQSIKNLTLKFVAHHGTVTEISVGRLKKQSGPEMIVAHRLLKNNIDGHEYLLVTEKLLQNEPDEDEPDEDEPPGIVWNSSSAEYAFLGQVDYRFVLLDDARKKAPGPPEPDNDYQTDNTPFFEIPIDAYYKDVFMILKNIPEWASWVPGLYKVEQDQPEVYVGSIHYCEFEGYKSVISPLKFSMSGENILFAESCRLPELNISVVHEYMFKNAGPGSSLFCCRVLNASEAPLPADLLSQLTDHQKQMALMLKEQCEKMEGSFF